MFGRLRRFGDWSGILWEPVKAGQAVGNVLVCTGQRHTTKRARPCAALMRLTPSNSLIHEARHQQRGDR